MNNQIQYLTFDSIEEGVGASQVLNYISKLSQKYEITLINFEKSAPTDLMRKTLVDLGIIWEPLKFGKTGALQGLFRVVRLALKLNRRLPIHARGDLAALAAIISGNRKVLWDCRALHADQRLAISTSKSKYAIYLLNRSIEYIIAKKSKIINVITYPAATILSRRYNLPISKFSVISTCVDLEQFQLKKMPEQSILKLLIPGTLSAAYDVNLMNMIICEIRKIHVLQVTLAVGHGADNYWKGLDYDLVKTIPHSQMPEEMARSHFGMSIWKANLGLCLAAVSSTKIPEFLATGRPVFANFNQGDIGTLLEEYGCGVATSLSGPEYAKEYAESMLQLIADKSVSKACRELANDNYSLDEAILKLDLLYDGMQSTLL